MTEFMKTVLNTLHQNSHMHFDFTTLKSVKFTPVMEKIYRERRTGIER